MAECHEREAAIDFGFLKEKLASDEENSDSAWGQTKDTKHPKTLK